ncbi:MAG: L-lactate permease [Anaerolineales bacterium]
MVFLDIVLAVVPISLILFLMLGLRWKSSRAGLAAWIAALIVAVLRFGVGGRILWWAHVRALFLALYVLYIIWGALLFYRVTEAAGVLDAMGTLMHRMAPTQAAQVLLLAWGLTSFFQGVGGFGVPVAIVAPMMVGLGFSMAQAVVIPSLGDTWAVSFGSLGSAFNALAATTGVSEPLLATWSALHMGLLCLVMGLFALWAADGWATVREGWLPLLLMGVAMAGMQFVTAHYGLPNIAAMVGALAGLLVGSIWALLRFPEGRSVLHEPVLLTRALLPYGLLLALILVARLIVPLQVLLRAVVLQVPIPGLVTGRGWVIEPETARAISVFGHTGALLIYASLITYGWARYAGYIEGGHKREILRKVLRSGLSSTLTILSMVAVASIMDYAGMLQLLSELMAGAAGRLFPLVSPFIGALGGFVTGSNSNSNVLFGVLQRNVAETLHYVVPLILGAQNAGAAVGATFSPSKILVGCSTVDLDNCEAIIMQQLLGYTLLALIILALFTWLLTLVY